MCHKSQLNLVATFISHFHIPLQLKIIMVKNTFHTSFWFWIRNWFISIIYVENTRRDLKSEGRNWYGMVVDVIVIVIVFVIVGDKRESVVVCGRVMWTNNDWLASYTLSTPSSLYIIWPICFFPDHSKYSWVRPLLETKLIPSAIFIFRVMCNVCKFRF